MRKLLTLQKCIIGWWCIISRWMTVYFVLFDGLANWMEVNATIPRHALQRSVRQGRMISVLYGMHPRLSRRQRSFRERVLLVKDLPSSVQRLPTRDPRLLVVHNACHTLEFQILKSHTRIHHSSFYFSEISRDKGGRYFQRPEVNLCPRIIDQGSRTFFINHSFAISDAPSSTVACIKKDLNCQPIDRY